MSHRKINLTLQSSRVTTATGHVFYAEGGVIRDDGGDAYRFVNEATGRTVCFTGPATVEQGEMSPARNEQEIFEQRQQAQVRFLQKVADRFNVTLDKLAELCPCFVEKLVRLYEPGKTPPNEYQLAELFARPEFEPTVQTVVGEAAVPQVREMMDVDIAVPAAPAGSIGKLERGYFVIDPAVVRSITQLVSDSANNAVRRMTCCHADNG